MSVPEKHSEGEGPAEESKTQPSPRLVPNEEGSFRRRESLAFRLSLAVALMIFIAMMVTSSLLSYMSFQREVTQQTEALEATAKVFATTLADPLASSDSHTVRQILTGIGQFDQFQFATVFDRDEQPIAEVGYDAVLQRNNVSLSEQTTLGLLTHSQLWVQSNIVKSGEVIGSLKLLSDISPIRNGLLFNFGISLALAFAAALATILICLRAVKALTRPVSVLSDLMQRFGQDKNYDVRAEASGKGEVGVLARSFNKMLGDLALANSELLEYQTSLEQKVEVRTRELSIAKNDAEMANAAKSEFLATMSHEIRTPMNGMLVMAELLATADLAPKHQRYADVVMKSGRGLLAIINDVLDFSKIESGHLELESIPVDLRTLTEDVLSLFWQQASEKHIDLGCFVDEGLPQVIDGDPVRLNQVLSNLVSNALKFTETGQVTIHVERCNSRPDVPSLSISVCDTGIGIHRDKLASVFESFTQADQSTTRKYGGTGLGLPICKRLVEAMDGSIRVESEPGAGTTFTFSLPIRDAKPTAVTSGTFSGKRVLLALPDTATYQVLRDAIRRIGAEITAVVPDHISRECGSDFDLVIGDPKTVAALEPQPGRADRLLITQLGDFSADSMIADGTADDVLSMPISTYSALEAVDRVLSGHARGKAVLQTGQSAGRPEQTFEGAAVLIVDDSAVNREVAVQALRRFQIEPVVAENGLEAIGAAQNARFDLIFMDCSMPEMDGFQATDHIRRREREDQVDPAPIVALTAHVADHICDQVEASGMNSILVKPFTMDALCGCLEQYLNGDAEVAAHELDIASKSNSADDQPVLDAEAQANLRDILGDVFDDSFARILNLYLDTVPDALAGLEAAHESNDLPGIAAAAHAMKSMAANATATRLADSCAQLEALAANRDAAGLSDAMDALRSNYSDTEQAIQALVATLERDALVSRSA